MNQYTPTRSPILLSNTIAGIPLTQGKIALVNIQDVAYLSQWNWTIHKKGYAIRTDRSTGKKITIRMHRVILERTLGRELAPFPTEEVDHINDDRLNNTRENLRLATHSQNQHNRTMQRNNKSGYKGVCWIQRNQRWRARIRVNKKLIYLGEFRNREEAYQAYCAASQLYHGEFARNK